MIAVLYVDDEPDLLTLAQCFLEQDGEFSVTISTSARRMLKSSEIRSFDAIVSDYQMPEMDGIEFLKAVREQIGTIPFILFTGRGREEIVIQAINHGADFYLQKGGEPTAQFAELAHKIRQAVLRKRAEQELQKKNDELNASYEQIAAAEEELRQQLNELVEKQGALKESEERFRAFTENIPDLTTIVDATGMYTYVSPSIQQITGWRAEDLLGKRIGEIDAIFGLVPEDIAALRNAGKTAMQQPGLPVPMVPFRVHDTHGAVLYVEGSLTFLPGVKGIQGIVFHGRDVTDRVRAEEELRRKNEELNASYEQITAADEELRGQYEDLVISEKRIRGSEAKFRSLFEKTHDALILFSERGCIDCNQQAVHLFGYTSKEELLGLTPPDVSPPLQPDGQDSKTAATARMQDVLEKGGDHFEWLQQRKDGSTFSADVLLSIFDLDGEQVFLSSVRDITERKGMEEEIRRSRDMFRSIIEHIQDAYVRTDSDGKIAMVSPSAAHLYGYDSEEEMIGLHASALYAHAEGRARTLRKVQEANGKVHDFMGIGKRKDGTTFWASLNIQILTDDQGKVIGTEGMVRDITESRMMERAIGEANKKLSLLSSITRHDVVNQLTMLQGYTQLAAMKNPDPVVGDFLAKIGRTTETITRLIGFTKVYQELGVRSPAWFRLETVTAAAGSAEVRPAASCGKIEIFADPMIERVFFNLFDNARRHGGHVTEIAIRCEQVSDGLLIVVEDNGDGIAPEEKERIFEKGYGKNSGFGLFLVREILAITGIAIRETGYLGAGARFEITVPPEAFRIAAEP